MKSEVKVFDLFRHPQTECTDVTLIKRLQGTDPDRQEAST